MIVLCTNHWVTEDVIGRFIRTAKICLMIIIAIFSADTDASGLRITILKPHKHRKHPVKSKTQ